MKTKVLVIFGSMSSEHEVSCISASNVLENIDNQKYDVYKLGIDKLGKWYLYTGNIETIKENKWIQDEQNKVSVIDIVNELQKYDVIFPVLHGKYGEDGTIQGLFELAKVKYVGCKVLGSAIAMDKILSKTLVSQTGIPVVDYLEVSKTNYNKMQKDENCFNEFATLVESKLSFPIIVKPNQEGSSYGVTKVDDVDNLMQALDISFKYDNKVLIEKYISNRQEVECAVIEKQEEIYTSTPGEIVSANEFYDFDAKYINDNSYIKIPAAINPKILEKIQEYSKEIFRILKLSGLSRVDFFISGDNIYFNEVNTMPGFTSTSMYPKMLIHDSISYKETLNILIDSCNKE